MPLRVFGYRVMFVFVTLEKVFTTVRFKRQGKKLAGQIGQIMCEMILSVSSHQEKKKLPPNLETWNREFKPTGPAHYYCY